jgi:hypothetical protein
MLLRLSNPALLPDLRQHFARSGFSVADEGESLLVGRADAPSAEQERREVEMHLRVWQMMHPDAQVEVAP